MIKIVKKMGYAIKCHQIAHHDYELYITVAYEDEKLDGQEKMIKTNHAKIVYDKKP
jgi:hypothetical protein